jgi:CopA family copper-resistance protein
VKPDRRQFVLGLAAAGSGALALPRAALAAAPRVPRQVLRGTHFNLDLQYAAVNITGKPRTAMLINGSLPGPILHWREGDDLTLRVTNRLDVPTSIHWHGVIVPTGMDGVPGISYPGISPGETFVYRFPVRQSGTFWYHSHTRFQEQNCIAGALVIHPREPDPVQAHRDYVVQFNDWTDENPEHVFYHLKTGDGYYNYHKRTLVDFIHDIDHKGLSATLKNRWTWSTMRMDPRDIVDVSGAQTGGTYTYLINGEPPAANWTGLFKPGERVRLRLINSSAMSYFDVRIPGLKMTVVDADGSHVEPVSVDELRIAVAETYDVIVTPREDAYTIFAQSMDRSGYARATLAVRAGLTAPVPAMDPIYNRTMVDMGMTGMSMGPMQLDHRHMTDMHGSMGGMRMGARRSMHVMDLQTLTGASRPAPPNATGQIAFPQPQDVHMKLGPQVVHLVAHPTQRLNFPGDGLNGNGRDVLTYERLVRLAHGPQNAPFVTREPDADVLLHLTGNMRRYIFGFNGLTFNQSEPVRLPYGQRIRVTLINDTMMSHPIHLHGMFTELDNHRGRLRPLKHTINVKPAEFVQYYVNATEIGRWAYHCHLLYHMEGGMFTSAVVA